MANNQCLVSYPGVTQIRSAYYALYHGITPGVIILEILPQNNLPKMQGDVVWTVDGVEVLRLTDCRLNDASYEVNENGQIWRINILDRRWRWAGPVSMLRANVRGPSGIMLEGTKKSIADILTFFLQGLGETDFDLSQAPTDGNPSLDIDYLNTAKSLADFCDTIKCRIVLSSDNKIHICVAGVGAQLPSDGTFSYTAMPDPPEAPDNIIIVGSPIRFQADFDLIAVGLDVDGSIRPIEELSYRPDKSAPDGGWGESVGVPYYFKLADEISVKANQLAAETVLKWYRIKINAAEGSTLDKLNAALPVVVSESLITANQPGAVQNNTSNFALLRLDQLLPLEGRQIDQVANPYQNPDPNQPELIILEDRPPVVYGLWYSEDKSGNDFDGNSCLQFGFIQAENGVEVKLAKLEAAQEDADDEDLLAQYDSTASVLIPNVPFILDTRLGIVKFSDPVYYKDHNDNAQPAVLALRTTFSVKDNTTKQWVRWARSYPFSHPLQKNAAGPSAASKIPVVNRWVMCPEITYCVRWYCDAEGNLLAPYTNMYDSLDGLLSSTVFQPALLRVQQVKNEYVTVPNPQVAKYVGFRQFTLDGAISMIIWETSKAGCFTTAHRNNDVDQYITSYADRRFAEKSLQGIVTNNRLTNNIMLAQNKQPLGPIQ